ncbi:MAG: gfo/Idh/MocA family oxidoreductase, partial [Clostridia bacterium]|nr:gfo/Idh/MocA family oxidoreductase [Clostridia bacterium]
MNNKVLRVGFVGVSGRGSGMLELLLQVEGVTVPAVCDVVPERSEHGISIVTEFTGGAYPVHG